VHTVGVGDVGHTISIQRHGVVLGHVTVSGLTVGGSVAGAAAAVEADRMVVHDRSLDLVLHNGWTPAKRIRDLGKEDVPVAVGNARPRCGGAEPCDINDAGTSGHDP